MPREITVVLQADVQQFERKVKSAMDAGSQNVRGFRNALDSSTLQMMKMAEAAERTRRSFRDLGDTFSSVGRNMTVGLTLPLTALGAAAVKTATDFDSLKRGLVAVSGSAENAEKQLVRLKEVAKLPGLGFREAIQGSTNLQAAGLSAERAEKALKAFGNALATVGKGKAELDGVILALSQIESKGKVSAEEINQLAERVPQIRQIMIRAFGTADTEILQRAKITSRQFTDTIVAELEKLPKVTGGARNAFENLKDSIEQSLLPLGNKLLETILPAIERLSPKVLGLLEGFGKLSPGTQDLVIGFGAAAIAAGPFINAIGNLTKAIVALNAASSTGLMARLLSGPVVLTAAVVGTTAVQTFREATGNQEMIDRIGGPDLDRITRIMKQRELSGADAFRQVAQELKDQALIAQLQKEQPGLTLPALSGAEAFRRFGGGKPAPAIDAVALATANAEAAKAARSRRDRSIGDFDQGQRALLEHEIALAGIRQSIAATIARRQALPEGIGLPTLPLTAAGATDIVGFPTGELRELARAADDLERLPHLLSDSERFMRGFAAATRTVGDAFEQFGSNVAFAFTNVKTLFEGLKRAVFDFFNDLLGSALQNLVRGTLGSLFGNLGGSLGNLFRTPSFAGGFGGGGGGISVPPSISQGIGSFFSGGGGGGSARSSLGGLTLDPLTAKELGLGGSFLGGVGRSFAGAAPLLGLGLGGSLGGQSILGQITGSAGGLLGGGAVAGFSGALSAGAKAFFTNPFTIAIGAGLLVGSFFLGKAKQRRSDEALSGQFLTQALQGIEQLAGAVASGQITTLAEARGIFDRDILGVFQQQISGLKTKSVRDSRLTNQVRDLQNVFNARIPPLIAENERRAADLTRFAAIDSRLVPQFGVGGPFGIDRAFAVVGQGAGGRAASSAPASITLNVQLGMSSGDAQQVIAHGFNSKTGEDILVNTVQSARGRGRIV